MLCFYHKLRKITGSEEGAMIKVFLVEDETIIRQGIKHNID